MNTPETQPRPPRTPRGVKIVLAMSLAINLLIAGAVGGAFLGGRPEGGMRDRAEAARILGLGPLATALDRRDRAAVISAAGADRAAMRAERQRLVEAARDFAEAVRADPFDRAEAEAALERQRAIVSGLQDRGYGALLDYLEPMPAEDRAAFADSLQHMLARQGRGR